jgi:hypothetical protein
MQRQYFIIMFCIYVFDAPCGSGKVADCCEKAYQHLLLADAAALLCVAPNQLAGICAQVRCAFGRFLYSFACYFILFMSLSSLSSTLSWLCLPY